MFFEIVRLFYIKRRYFYKRSIKSLKFFYSARASIRPRAIIICENLIFFIGVLIYQSLQYISVDIFSSLFYVFTLVCFGRFIRIDHKAHCIDNSLAPNVGKLIE